MRHNLIYLKQDSFSNYYIRVAPYFILGVSLRSQINAGKCIIFSIYGISKYNVTRMSRHCGRVITRRIGEITLERIMLCEEYIKSIPINLDRKRMEYDNVYKHVKRGTVRGLKMRNGLPVRGQRTSSNAKTSRKLNTKRF